MEQLFITDGMCFVDAPIADLRERNQQAVFLLGTNDILIKNKQNDEKERLTIANFHKLQDLSNEWFLENDLEFSKISCYARQQSQNILKIIIPKHKKSDFLDELSYRGITKGFIYPTLDNYCEQIKEYSKNAKKAENESFRLWSEHL